MGQLGHRLQKNEITAEKEQCMPTPSNIIHLSDEEYSVESFENNANNKTYNASHFFYTFLYPSIYEY